MIRTLAIGAIFLIGCSKESATSGKGGDQPSGGGSKGKVASCLSEAMHSCVEYNADNLAMGTDMVAKLCTSLDAAAKFTETACPTTKVIATCQRSEGKDVHYEGYAIAAPDIEKSCKERGGTPGK